MNQPHAFEPDLGEHCRHCRQLDYLPFRCPACREWFCLAHHHQDKHECPYAAVIRQSEHDVSAIDTHLTVLDKTSAEVFEGAARALDVVLRNIAVTHDGPCVQRPCVLRPCNVKYRRLRLSNPRVRNCVVEVPGALAMLRAIGFEEIDSETLELPSAASLVPVYAAHTKLRAMMRRRAKVTLSSVTCSARGCKAMPPTPVICRSCRLPFCVAHRFEADHQCGQAKRTLPLRSGTTRRGSATEQRREGCGKEEAGQNEAGNQKGKPPMRDGQDAEEQQEHPGQKAAHLGLERRQRGAEEQAEERTDMANQARQAEVPPCVIQTGSSCGAECLEAHNVVATATSMPDVTQSISEKAALGNRSGVRELYFSSWYSVTIMLFVIASLFLGWRMEAGSTFTSHI